MMSTFFPLLLGVLLLSNPPGQLSEPKTTPQPNDGSVPVAAPPSQQKTMRIRSRSCEYDGQTGAIVFKGTVQVDYENEYALTADRVFVRLANSNQLERVVASGNVVLSNDLHKGTCAVAIYRKAKGEIEMFGERNGPQARLMELGEQTNQVEGDRIRFWIGSEEVEVTNSRLSIEYAKQENAR